MPFEKFKLRFLRVGLGKIHIVHGEMNHFSMTKSTREMRVVPKDYLNNPLQLWFNEKPKILSSKNHLLAHWSP